MAGPPPSGAAGLERFVEAQDADACFDRALAELESGHKRGHWMWFVFPQLAGLGRSSMAQRFALSSLEEARAYLDHPVLGPRLRRCARAILALEDSDPEALLGPVDTLKLRSSMTLFHRAAPEESVFPAVLERCFDGQADPLTDALLEDRPGPSTS